MKKISIIIPVFNEQEVIKECIKRINKVFKKSGYRYEIIFIDDGSEDNSLKILKKHARQEKNIKILSFSRNFGHQMAITCGMDYAGGDAAAIIDADLQDPPEILLKMLKKWEEGYHIIYGKRQKRKGESFFKLLTAKIFYRILSFFTEIKIPLDTGDFRVIDKKVLEQMRSVREKHRFMRGLTVWVGFKTTYVKYDRDRRYAGRSKYPFFKMLRFAIDGITSFSSKPLKLATLLGFMGFITGLGLTIYAVISYFYFTREHSGWTSTMLVIIFFGSTQLFTLGILGEYLGRMHEELKKRPLYIVNEKINIKKKK
ncbi:MAG TPA: glycosyltransferase family 2 protein [Spirochaetota bacterium]|nr:glycosyltransferase family 2 protein [Spirochaetota bacterium]